MKKLLHIGKGIAFCIGCVISATFGWLMFLATAVGKERSGGSLLDVEFIYVYLIFGPLIVVCLIGASRNFRQAVALALAERVTEAPKPGAPLSAPLPSPLTACTPNEKLAHLVKRQ